MTNNLQKDDMTRDEIIEYDKQKDPLRKRIDIKIYNTKFSKNKENASYLQIDYSKANCKIISKDEILNDIDFKFDIVIDKLYTPIPIPNPEIFRMMGLEPWDESKGHPSILLEIVILKFYNKNYEIILDEIIHPSYYKIEDEKAILIVPPGIILSTSRDTFWHNLKESEFDKFLLFNTRAVLKSINNEIEEIPIMLYFHYDINDENRKILETLKKY